MGIIYQSMVEMNAPENRVKQKTMSHCKKLRIPVPLAAYQNQITSLCLELQTLCPDSLMWDTSGGRFIHPGCALSSAAELLRKVTRAWSCEAWRRWMMLNEHKLGKLTRSRLWLESQANIWFQGLGLVYLEAGAELPSVRLGMRIAWQLYLFKTPVEQPKVKLWNLLGKVTPSGDQSHVQIR